MRRYTKFHESCIGCGISTSAGCLIRDYLKDDEQCRNLCPCAECLVKPVCQKYCAIRMTLYNDVSKKVYELREKNKERKIT